MSTYTTEIRWSRGDQVFTDHRYSRKHRWLFDGGIEVPASSSPKVVPVPCSDPAAVDPEEAFLASLSSCHMLWFLSIAARRGFTVDDYADTAEGHLEKNAGGKLAMTRVVLRPHVTFSGPHPPDRATLDALHDAAHEECFLARSVLSEIRIEPQAD